MEKAREIRVEASPTRCPYCHSSVEASEAEAIVCATCLSRHHRECWTGECASCRATGALGRVEAGPVAERRYEKAMAIVNHAFVAVFCLQLIALPLSFPYILSAKPAEGLPPALLPMMILGMLGGLIGTLASIIDVYDAAKRHRRESSAVPLILAILGFLTGGITSIVYYYGWGRKPMPGDPSRPRAPRVPSSKEQ